MFLDILQNNQYYKKYVQYYGSTTQYKILQSTIYYDEIYESYQVAIKQVMASTYRSKTITSILENNYQDCMLRISDREDL